MFTTLRIPPWLTPVRATFLASLLLSLVARLGSTLNRDGMLYVKGAQAFLDGGFTAAREVFNWPFLSIAMAVVGRLTGLGPETAGYLLNALFMAGACALMVACIARRTPELSWLGAFVVLALPGLNEYRNELLREYGCWFFVMLAFWLALRWAERPRWPSALALQAALGGAALFRPEALALFPALLLWQLAGAPRAERGRRLLMLGGLPLAGGIALAALYVSGGLAGGGRLAEDLGRFRLARFDAKAQALASALVVDAREQLVVFAQEQARTILLFGSLALVPLKVLQKLGLFVVPLAFALFGRAARPALGRHPLFAWGIAAHLLVLAVFVVDLQFLAGRYVGLILLFSTPFAAAGLAAMLQHRPRWRITVFIGMALLALANVVSTSPGKTHLVDAGRWLAANVADPSTVYIDSGRTAYHAGWQTAAVAERNQRPAVEKAVAEERYALYVLEHSRKDAPLEDWLAKTGLRVVTRFEHPNRDAVIIAAPASRKP
ncbi:glycosyltransferase family 39 protein [Azospira restricta]|uniref:Glycosyltransferase family 39 protein n=1 Tax=Azospira restricta TaxID=404405 RepID=A0A974SQW5_9RHOO|nr:glycosyltransferase family 39 protein [Azospira restricta]QRJ64812.1 glycosyltransferase family 39 protein [Azospira restricta]